MILSCAFSFCYVYFYVYFVSFHSFNIQSCRSLIFVSLLYIYIYIFILSIYEAWFYTLTLYSFPSFSCNLSLKIFICYRHSLTCLYPFTLAVYNTIVYVPHSYRCLLNYILLGNITITKGVSELAFQDKKLQDKIPRKY